MNTRPVIAITMGDPAGIGPEISAKALDNPALYKQCKPLIIGDADILELGLKAVGKENRLKINTVQDPSQGCYEYGTLDVLDLGIIKAQDHVWGEVRAAFGDAAFRYVEKAIELAMTKKVDATVTNALNKEAMNLGGHHYAGHTEIYADKTEAKSYAMMLAHKNMRVVHVSTHVSLREACDRVRKARVLECIRLADEACKKMGIDQPVVAVAGLNPHAGEHGMFGREEIEEIMPAIETARKDGLNIEGPIPADTVFSKMKGGWYDIVVVMYHDQGHIPLKLEGFVFDREKNVWEAVEGVNITLGLPIIRVSVDHGTAFDQAGKGTASELSLNHAIEYAVAFAKH